MLKTQASTNGRTVCFPKNFYLPYKYRHSSRKSYQFWSFDQIWSDFCCHHTENIILPRKSKIVFKRLVALKEAENHTFVVEAMKKMLGLKKCKFLVLKFLRKNTYLWYEFEYLWYEFEFLLIFNCLHFWGICGRREPSKYSHRIPPCQSIQNTGILNPRYSGIRGIRPV